MNPQPLDLVIAAIVAWIVIGALGLVRPRHFAFITRVLFPAGSAVGLALAVVAFIAIGFAAAVDGAAAGTARPALPPAPGSAVGVLPAAAGRDRHGDLAVFGRLFPLERGHGAGLICFQYHVFLAAMALVLVADDAYLFMVAWESMALSSYFLVTTDTGFPRSAAPASCTC